MLFLARTQDREVLCPSLVAWRMAIARDINKEDSNAQNIQRILDTCKTLGSRRRCRIEHRNDRTLLIEEESMKELRLVFWPGDTLSNLGGIQSEHKTRHLRLDVALLRVPPSQTPDKGIHSTAVVAQIPEANTMIWVAHHPEPSFRNHSTPEVQAFFEQALPVLASRVNKQKPSLETQRIKILQALQSKLLEQARRRDLKALRFIRKELPTGPTLHHPFTTGLEKLRSINMGLLAEFASPYWYSRNWTYSSLPQPAKQFPAGWALTTEPTPRSVEELYTLQTKIQRLASQYQENRPYRQNVWSFFGLSAVGLDGDGTVRMSKGAVIEEPSRWADVLGFTEANKITKLGLPGTMPWSSQMPLGFKIDADLAPFGTGGPVFDETGNLLGIVSAGDENTIAGLFRYQPEHRVFVVSMLSILRVLNAYGGRKIAQEIGH